MKKLGFLFIVINIFIVLAGCNGTENNNIEEVHFVEVDIQTPQKIEPQEEVEISAYVTQGEENVEDADEVKFEIWENGNEEHEMIEAKHKGEGIYSITTTFNNEAIYNVVAHVTARNMHNMPKVELIVGEPKATEEDVSSEDAHQHEDEGEHKHEDNEDHHHHGHGNVVIDFQKPEDINLNEESHLLVKLTSNDTELTQANVTLEIWKNEEDKHEFLSTKEQAIGEYSLAYVFKSSGIYNVRIHVEKDDIHEHIEKTIVVTN